MSCNGSVGRFVICQRLRQWSQRSISPRGVTTPERWHNQGEVQCYGHTSCRELLHVPQNSRFLEIFSSTILFTGDGFSETMSREILKDLTDLLKIPVHGFFYCNGSGMEILSVYKVGSRNMYFDAMNLAVPSMQWLRLYPSNPTLYDVPELRDVS